MEGGYLQPLRNRSEQPPTPSDFPPEVIFTLLIGNHDYGEEKIPNVKTGLYKMKSLAENSNLARVNPCMIAENQTQRRLKDTWKIY